MTGITRFSNQSLFSKLNNMRDLTFSSAFSSAFGYTQAELEAYFDEGIGEYIGKHPDAGREGLLESLRHWYDGYRFSEEAEKVYNPVSINSFFRDDGMAFEPYWANTASTEMVVELAKRIRFSFIPGEGVMVDRGVLQNFRIESFAPDAEPDLIEAYGYLYMAATSP